MAWMFHLFLLGAGLCISVVSTDVLQTHMNLNFVFQMMIGDFLGENEK